MKGEGVKGEGVKGGCVCFGGRVVVWYGLVGRCCSVWCGSCG